MAKRVTKAGKRTGKSGSRAARGRGRGADLLTIGQIRQLVELMVANDVQSIHMSDGELRLAIRRGPQWDSMPAAHGVAPPPAPPVSASGPAAAMTGGARAQPAKPQGESQQTDEGVASIESPMVGTFYAAPDPDSQPYVTVGSEVTPDTVVCIVEAMKVFNEIKAEVSGTIEKVCVENAHPVEFGQPLFLVRPRA
jgi:acetyl-CoA carboxylase biotin carboxyl carrier protein